VLSKKRAGKATERAVRTYGVDPERDRAGVLGDGNAVQHQHR
jgi:hypothetical protein